MKYNSNSISISISNNEAVYEIRKDYTGNNSILLDRVVVSGKDMVEVAEKCQKLIAAEAYGTPYYKQMFVCVEIGNMLARAIRHTIMGNEEAASVLLSYIKEDIVNSGMDKEALYRMVSCFASQYGVNISFLLGKPMVSMF